MNTERPVSPGAEALLGKQIPLAPHGYVTLLDYMGDDYTIEAAARVSNQRGTRTKRDAEGLIRYLYRNGHTSPFEQVCLRLEIQTDKDTIAQFERHRMAALVPMSRNQESQRYSLQTEATFYVPHVLCRQAKHNKQGRGEALPDPQASAVQAMIENHNADSQALYDHLVDKYDLARETARCVLPGTICQKFVVRFDLHNLFHFLALRLDNHAQYEIRALAAVIVGIVQAWVPMAWRAFSDYRLNAVQLSLPEQRVLRRLGGFDLPPYEEATAQGLTEREWNDLRAKLANK